MDFLKVDNLVRRLRLHLVVVIIKLSRLILKMLNLKEIKADVKLNVDDKVSENIDLDDFTID